MFLHCGSPPGPPQLWIKTSRRSRSIRSLPPATWIPTTIICSAAHLQRTGQIDRAVKAYDAALGANPNHARTLDALGRLYVKNDRHSALEQAALRLVRQPGWEARGQFMLGISRAELNDPAGAAQALGRFFELDPEGHAAAPRAGEAGSIALGSVAAQKQAAREGPAVAAGIDSGGV